MKHHFRIVLLCKRRKQAIALLPILSEKQGATYVFSLKHGSDGRIVYDNIQIE